MKLAPYLFGVISAQGSGDYDYGAVVDEGDRGSYGGGYSGGYSSGYSAPSYSFNYGGRAGTQLTVTAVTCWESNNMGTHGAEGDEHTNHFFNSRDGFGWDHTHHGHQTSVGTIHVHLPDTDDPKDAPEIQGSDPGRVSDHDYHSELAFDHRLSGCIYEASDWMYNAYTYNRYHEMSYGAGTNASNGYDSDNGELIPIWWHYFNSHVLPRGSNGGVADPGHKLVMANPTYEGLGYLNFIVTFLKSSNQSNEVGKKSTDREMNGNDHSNADDNHTDLYSNGSAFTLTLNNDDPNPCNGVTNAVDDSKKCWYSVYSTSNAASNDWENNETHIAISSFPHNDLGKDFRFNLRILHHLGEGNASHFYDSYYWYRVNKISITFPYTVSCPWDISGSPATNGNQDGMVVHKCMDSAGLNGHVFWQDSDEPGTNAGDGHGKLQVAYTETITDGSNNVQTLFAGVCHNTASTAKRGQHKCGEQYSVQGLMNAYDEYAQQEYGTHQEHWFQFYYKFRNGDDTNGSSNAKTGQDLDDVNLYIYNYPNKLFNAFEIETITIACEEGDANKNWTKNRCLSYDDGTARAHEHWSSPQNGSPTSG